MQSSEASCSFTLPEAGHANLQMGDEVSDAGVDVCRVSGVHKVFMAQ